MASYNWPSVTGAGGVPIYPTLAAFPVTATQGDLGVAADTGNLYVWNGSAWVAIGTPGSVLSMGTIDSVGPSSDGAVISFGHLYMQSASISSPGLVNLASQTFAGAKIFSTLIQSPTILLTGSSNGVVTIVPQAAAGTYSFLLPVAPGTSGQVLTSGGGVSAMTWSNLPTAGITSLTGDVTGTGPGATASTVAAIRGTTVTGTTGTVNVVFSNSPSLITPNLGTPSVLVGTNLSGVGLGFTSGKANSPSVGLAHSVVVLDGSGAFAGVVPGISGQVLTSNGTDWVSGALPAFGSVTSVSVVTANGLAGSVANATSTPAITLSTTITGILQGNGTAISAASTTGSGAVVLATSPTISAPSLGTPTFLLGTNITGTGASFTAGRAIGPSIGVSNGVVTVDGSVNFTGVGPGLSGQVLTSNGTNWVSAALPNFISSLTGDVTGTGPGATATTVAKIQGVTVSGTTGTGSVVFSNSPSLVTPALGTPSTLVGTNITGTAVSLTSGRANAPTTGAAHAVVVQDGTGNFAGVLPGASGNALLSNGSDWVSTTLPAGGTVTSISVVGANGLAGTVANATTTPTITLTTTITGILQGNGTAISAASVTGSGSVVLATSPTLVTPALGTPSALIGTNISGTGLGFTSGRAIAPNAGTAHGVVVLDTSSNFVSVAPSTSGNVLTSNGTDWVSGNLPNFISSLTGDITGTGPGAAAATVAKIQGVTVSGTTGTVNVVFSNSPTLVSPALGTPSALVGTNITGTGTGFTAGRANAPTTGISNGVVTLDGTGLFSGVAPGTAGNLLTSNGSNWVSTTPSTSGTVTTVSVVSANGLAGSVANPTTTPSITLSTTITGILQGNGTALSAASTTGSGAVVLATSPTLTTPALGTPSALIGTNITGTGAGFTAGHATAPASGAAHGVVVLNSVGNFISLAPGASGLVLTSNGTDWAASALPNFITSLTGDVTGTGPGATVTSVAAIRGTTVSGTTGTGNVVFSTSPTLVNPALGTPSALVGTNITGTGASFIAGEAIAPAAGVANGVVTLDGTGHFTGVAAGASGHVLTSNGSAWVSSVPANSGTVTSVSVVTANGLAGTVASATTTPAITLSTTITGILQGNGTAISAASVTGTGAVVQATNATLIAPSLGTPTALVGTNITGTALGLTAGIAIAPSTGTAHGVVVLDVSDHFTSVAPGVSGHVLTSNGTDWVSSNLPAFGSVTSVSIVTANGLSGLVANPTTTPAITLTTTVTGILQGNGTTISAASTTGSGPIVLENSPTILTPILTAPDCGTPTHLIGTNITGTATALTAGHATAPTTGTANGVVTLDNSANFQTVPPTTSGNILTANGTDWVSAPPATAGGTVTSVGLAVPAFLNVSGSPVTTNGTITVGLSGTALPISSGGTGQTSANPAFEALSPATTRGDLVYSETSNVPTRLPIGYQNWALLVNGGIPQWMPVSVGLIGQGRTEAFYSSGTFGTLDNSSRLTVYKYEIVGCGGGGGGGGGSGAGSGGGGQGGIATGTFTGIDPLTLITITIGSPGQGGSATPPGSNGTAGGTVTLMIPSAITVSGGLGGRTPANNGLGGAGGEVVSGTPNVMFYTGQQGFPGLQGAGGTGGGSGGTSNGILNGAGGLGDSNAYGGGGAGGSGTRPGGNGKGGYVIITQLTP